MSGAPLSDFARLEDKLAKLRQRERIAGEGRRLRGATPEALLAGVVTEIDETILPRRLSFSVEDGVTVHLAVANRRLQAMVSPAPGLTGIDVAAVADQPLADAEDTNARAVKDVLLAAFADAKPVSIQSARPAAEVFASDIGIPSNILARAWGVSDTPDEAPSAGALVSGFLSELKDDAVAWLRIEGEDVTDQGGDPEYLDALGEQAAVFLDGYFGKFETLYPDDAGASATAIGPMSRTGAAALFVEAGEVSAFIAAKAEKLPELAGRWLRLTGS